MNRRDFLKSLGAAAGSLAFAQTAAASMPLSAESDVIGYGWSDVGGGWYRLARIQQIEIVPVPTSYIKTTGDGGTYV